MKILVLGGDGFCGWPTSLHLAHSGHQVTIVDNLSRRALDLKMSSESLTDIFPIAKRIEVARKYVGDIEFKLLDVANDPLGLRTLINETRPQTIVHFAEQRSAPYSMKGDAERRYTLNNNITGTHNILSAIVDIDPDIHLVHLGTMGVYGYSDEFGTIPEGYLNVKITQTNNVVNIPYPTNPGSIYHMTKCLDQLMFQYYVKNWELAITDLHQGIVWGIETDETRLHSALVNRFDYDGIYGTVLNRFISQAANEQPLTVYGSGGQSRAFIHIQDTAQCVKLAVHAPANKSDKVRIFNQISEVQSIKGLAKLLNEIYGSEVTFIENPRKELCENRLEVDYHGLNSLGFEPITLSKGLINDIHFLAKATEQNFNIKNILNSPKW